MGTVTKSIGTSSRDYSTLQAWEDALPANLVTDGNAQVGECYNDSEFTATLTISGLTTNSTNNITLRCASGQSFKDHANKLTNRLAYNQSNGVGIRVTSGYATVITVSANNVTLEGLQVKATAANSTAIKEGSSPTGFVVNKCICSSAPASGNPVVNIYGGTSNKITNSLVIADTSVAAVGVRLGLGAQAINCTVVRPSNRTAGGNQFTSPYGTGTVRNCAIFGFTSLNGSYNADGHNVTDHTSAPGSTSNITSATYANQFVQSSTGSSVEDFRVVGTGSDLDDAGVTDTTNIPAGDDIVGQTRSTWDVGCWEYVAGGTTISATGAADSPGQANAIGALVAAAQATAQAPAQAYAIGALVAAAQATAQAPAQAYATGALVVAAAGVAHAAGQANASTGSAPIIVSGAGVAHAAGQASASAAATIAATGAAAAIAQANAFAAAVVAAAGSAQGVGQANGATGAAAPEFIEGNDAHYLLAHRRRNWPIAARQRDWLCQRHP